MLTGTPLRSHSSNKGYSLRSAAPENPGAIDGSIDALEARQRHAPPHFGKDVVHRRRNVDADPRDKPAGKTRDVLSLMPNSYAIPGKSNPVSPPYNPCTFEG